MSSLSSFCQCGLEPLGSGGWVQISVSTVTFEPSPGALATLRVSSAGYERKPAESPLAFAGRSGVTLVKGTYEGSFTLAEAASPLLAVDDPQPVSAVVAAPAATAVLRLRKVRRDMPVMGNLRNGMRGTERGRAGVSP